MSVESKPLVVIAGQPDWANEVRQTLGDDYTIAQYTSREGYVSRLVNDRPALILVGGDADNWPFWTATPRASPATRRIPIVLISEDKQVQIKAILSGADLAFPPDALADARQLVADYGHVRSAEEIERLGCECQERLPELAREGVEQFNAGDYYRQHDLFEALWMQTQGPVRDLYRAILQVGIAYFQITRGNYRGALKMLLRSVQWLAILPDVCQGVDVRRLREDSYRVRSALESLSPEEIDRLDRSLLKPVRILDE